MPETKDYLVVVRMPTKMVKAIDKRARSDKRTRSDVIRAAVEASLNG